MAPRDGLLAVATLLALVANHLRTEGPFESDPLSSPQIPQAVASLDGVARAAGAHETWWSAVQANLERAQYEASRTEAGLQAPNRAHNLRTHFLASGIEIVPRETGATGSWTWRWQTRRWGRPGSLEDVVPTLPSVEGTRISYIHTHGELVEWYENTPSGLEQGFTVAKAPPGGGPLMIEAHLESEALRQNKVDDRTVAILDGSGTCVLEYGGLAVSDATGRSLPARLTGSDRALAIVIEDDGATYPVTVDPLVTSPSWTAESNLFSANFGISVAPAGDVNGDGFSDVIVGAYTYNDGTSFGGACFVFHGSAAGLATTAAWSAAGNQSGALFGSSVAAGDVNGDGYSDVIIGAMFFDTYLTDDGRAFVWHGGPNGLGPNGTPANADWTYVPLGEGATNAQFGQSVASAGDVNGDGYSDVIVGAPGFCLFLSHPGCRGCKEGRAFVFHGSATGLAASPDWAASGTSQDNGLFGTSVASAGDVNADGFSDVIIGAPYHANPPTNCVPQSLKTKEGAAFVYLGSSAGLALSPGWTVLGNQAQAQLGSSVGLAGDVNGDSFSDVVVGAYLYDNGQTDEGRAFVFHGAVDGLATSPAWTAEGNQSEAWFGWSVGTAGDPNCDSYADVLVAARGYDNGQTDEGRAFVYAGSASGLAVAPAWTAEGDQASALFGYSAATAGDINGDGISDVVVGAPGFDNGQSNEGRAFVYHGGTTCVGTITGTVRGDGIPLADVTVNASGPGGFTASVVTGPDGVYGIPSVPPGCSNVSIVIPSCYQAMSPPGGTASVCLSGGEVMTQDFALAGFGEVAGHVLADGSPLPNTTVTLVKDSLPLAVVTTDATGSYFLAEVPAGPVDVSIVVPLGYSAVTPMDGSATVDVLVCATTTQDFALEAAPDAGPARHLGYWKASANYCASGIGTAQEPCPAMSGGYPTQIFEHFYQNQVNSIAVEGVTYLPGPIPMTLDAIQALLNYGGPSQLEKAKQQYLALLLNVASNRLRSTDVVSADGATASQAIQQIADMINDGYSGNDPDARLIAMMVNSAATLPAGTIDLSRPTIPFAPHFVQSPSARDLPRARPNPMVKAAIIDFEVGEAGPVTVAVYDSAGRRVRTLVGGVLEPGQHAIAWDGKAEGGSAVANGVYFYQVETLGKIVTSKLVVTQ